MMILPTASESAAMKSTRSSNMNRKELYESGSNWHSGHLKALHVRRQENVPLDRFFPAHLIPTSQDETFRFLEQEATRLSARQIREWDSNMSSNISNNRFHQFFKELAFAVATGQADDPGDVAEPDQSSEPESDSTGSSAMNEPEAHCEQALKAFVSAVLTVEELATLNNAWSIQVNAAQMPMELLIGTKLNDDRRPKKSINDGGIIFSKKDSKGTFRPRTDTPIASFEAKKRNLAGVHFKTGEPEPFVPSILAQEVAHLLGQAFKCAKTGTNTWNDHDGWLFSIHGSRMRLVNAFFTASYLRQVTSPILQRDQGLFVWHSVPWNLKYPTDRCEALKAVIAFLRLLSSGDIVNSYVKRAKGT